MKLQLLSTNNGMKSRSLKRLAEALTTLYGYKVWRTTGKRADRVQLQYGDLKDKLTQYKYFKQHNISALEFTTAAVEATKWLQQGFTVVGRKILNGSCGHGIVIIEGKEKTADGANLCPVYTKYKPKKREFRVHVFRDKVVAIVEKKRKADYQGDKKDAKIRNLEHGYIFAQTVELTDALRKRLEETSLAAAKVCSSDFRGVDVAYNEKNDDVFVIEVNSAPGIEGTNVERYAQAIKNSVVATAPVVVKKTLAKKKVAVKKLVKKYV